MDNIGMSALSLEDIGLGNQEKTKNPPLRNGINPEKMLEDHLPTEIQELEVDIQNNITSMMQKANRLMRLQILAMIINHESE